MYKVYRDPEGDHCLVKHSSYLTEHNCQSTIGRQFSEDDYKKRIENLNIEIKALNKELDKVFAQFLCALVYSTT